MMSGCFFINLNIMDKWDSETIDISSFGLAYPITAIVLLFSVGIWRFGLSVIVNCHLLVIVMVLLWPLGRGLGFSGLGP